jgi:hypothetical protein
VGRPLGSSIQAKINSMETKINFQWLFDFKRWYFQLSNAAGVGAAEIAAWLNDDIQHTSHANDMIDRLRGIQQGKEKKGYIGTGNAHSSYVFDDNLFLECQFNDDLKVILPIEEAIKALEAYARFKSGNWQDPNYQPEPFTVSYEYEGAEAEARYAETGLSWGVTAEEIAENTRKINVTDKKRKKQKRR